MSYVFLYLLYLLYLLVYLLPSETALAIVLRARLSLDVVVYRPYDRYREVANKESFSCV